MENPAENLIGIELKKTHWAIKNFIGQEFMREFGGTLAPWDGQLLSYLGSLEGKETTAGDICTVFRISKATCSENLHRAEEKGLIVLQPLEEDKRVRKIVLTKKGKEVAEQAHQLFFACQQKINHFLEEEEVAEMKRCLKKIREGIKEQ